ncbi:cytochrome P450 [Ceraceosorus guamensis]|uniref:Cytochrome P450 n=1 Tax=Ceraceosorus guamensis TaxID=1522189 RepID=A0A316W0D9_9BASI|nr:cytochrome P450 [Ceraceosorus guamensis]PWN41165.1 cytochrome P450 [Ceraceosorus guamensis]
MLVLVLFFSVAYLLEAAEERRQLKLPPGPPASLLFGSRLPAFDKHPWLVFDEMKKQYGPVITFADGPSKLIFVVTSLKAAQHILAEKAAISGDRPRSILVNEWMSGGNRVLLMPRNDRFRKYRRIYSSALSDKASAHYESIQSQEAKDAMLQLAQCTDDKQWQHVLTRLTASIIMSVIYDIRVEGLHDPRVQTMIKHLFTFTGYVLPGASVPDAWPILQYVPKIINPWKKMAAEFLKSESGIVTKLFSEVKVRVQQGRARRCFVSDLQEEQKALGLSDVEASYCSGALFGAGTHTTASALSVLVLAMLKYPAEYKKLQAEMDRVVGSDRMPSFEDELPFLQACLYESFRWRPITPCGAPHRLEDDIVWEGRVLPKGSVVYACQYSINRDPEVYSDVDTFKPDRFLDSTGKLTATRDAMQLLFGWGRRACPGDHVAMRSLRITLAMLAWSFDITSPLKPQDQPTVSRCDRGVMYPILAADFCVRSRTSASPALRRACLSLSQREYPCPSIDLVWLS